MLYEHKIQAGDISNIRPVQLPCNRILLYCHELPYSYLTKCGLQLQEIDHLSYATVGRLGHDRILNAELKFPAIYPWGEKNFAEKHSHVCRLLILFLLNSKL